MSKHKHTDKNILVRKPTSAGCGGKEIELADGRELWILADAYKVHGMQEWMIKHAIDSVSMPAVMHYALESAGNRDADVLVDACRNIASKSLDKVPGDSLRGVSVAAARVSNRISRMLECMSPHK